MKRSRWLLAGLALPLLGLWLLRTQPRLDVRMEHHPGHFWLVTSVALVNVALGVAVSEAARRHADARLLLVSLTFVASAGFLGLHALATPRVLLAVRTPGFVVATPVGLFLGACFAAVSSLDLEGAAGAALVRWHALLRGGLGLLLAVWALWSLGELPPFDRVIAEDAAEVPVILLGVGGVGLYLAAAVRYWRLHLRRPAPVLASVLVAFLLLAEAMVAVATAPSWRASWWEWHLLMAAGFGLVAWAAYRQYRREGAPASLFDAVSLDRTIRRTQEHYGAAVTALVRELRLRREPEALPAAAVAAEVAERFGLAGHCLPYLRSEGTVGELRATGMPLGLMRGMRYEEREQVVTAGSQILLHSDGLTEAHNPDREMFGLPRLVRLLASSDGQGTIETLLAALASFTGPGWEQEDDITLVTLERSRGLKRRAARRCWGARPGPEAGAQPSQALTGGQVHTRLRSP